MKKVAVFGATGQTGHIICELLLKDKAFEVIACARTTKKLERLKAKLDPSGDRLSLRTVDLQQGGDDLEQIINEADLIV